MPDLLSHMAAGYLLLAKIKSRAWFIVFLIGTCLPDLVTRPFYIIFPKLFWIVMPAHTPAGLFLLCLGLSGFFAARQRNRVFITLFAGCMLHLFLDLLQKHAHGGYVLLFPFSWDIFEFGLFYSEKSTDFLPLWLLLAGIIISRIKRKYKLNEN